MAVGGTYQKNEFKIMAVGGADQKRVLIMAGDGANQKRVINCGRG